MFLLVARATKEGSCIIRKGIKLMIVSGISTSRRQYRVRQFPWENFQPRAKAVSSYNEGGLGFVTATKG